MVPGIGATGHVTADIVGVVVLKIRGAHHALVDDGVLEARSKAFELGHNRRARVDGITVWDVAVGPQGVVVILCSRGVKP